MYYQTCPVHSGLLKATETTIGDYKRQYCYAGKGSWESCKRFQVKEIVGKCPLDVLPDSPMSAEEIIEQYDL
jgi:hypothetical protein